MIRVSAVSDRHPDLRLARLHLKTGLLALARAELEAAAGQGTLDRDGLADLAEVRWRTGDLVGAGLAAEAHLEQGGDVLVAQVVAAEYRFAEGRTAEAEAAARAAAEAGPVALRAVFAGLPAGPVWEGVLGTGPGSRGAEPSGSAAVRDRAVGRAVDEPSASRRPSTLEPSAAPASRRRGPPSGLASPRAAASSSPGSVLRRGAEPTRATSETARWLALARTALGEGRLEAGVAALGLALRFEPAAAEAVLDLLAELESSAFGEGRGDIAGLEVLRGDALQLVGREAEARAAYRRASEVLRRPAEG
ncbi:MAG: hypothetical protein KatS3mg065_1161 [Chloroflexota bacterium]|nr:MAG: hypothetical protein KatS3mg065_1161 [Chloroflexota bacterium]